MVSRCRKLLASSRPRRPGACGAEAGVKGPGARRHASRCAPPHATLSLAPAADDARPASDLRHGTPRLISLANVKAAAERARPHVQRTPLVPVEGALLKLECLQPTGSFKVRGFFAAALNLPPDRLRRGLITVSAGNAAQACAYAAKRLGVHCRVVMYDTA